MVPARGMPQPMLGSGVREVAELDSSSGLILAHQTNMFEGHLHNQLNEMNQSTPHNEMPRIRDDELGEKSGSENLEGTASGDDQVLTPHARKKRFHRHTQHQIQEMEAFFRECPHPDDKQRKELGRELGLVPLQVKFWFQNKRTQMKNQHERHENSQLRAENDKLRAENLRYKEALASSACPNCGRSTAPGDTCFDEHYVRIENARLREEIDKISGIAAKYVGKPMVPYPPLISPQTPSRSHDIAVGHFGDGESFGGGDLLRSVSEPSDTDKPLIIELAVAAMEELIRMGHEGEPLWVPQQKQGTNETADEVLNEDAYVQNFPRRMGPKPSGFHSEASRHSAMVIMNHTTLVRILMDVDQWSTTFWGIVSSATTLEVLSTGVGGNYDGALQLMAAEIQLPSPIVPTRESLFLRYSKQQDSGTWVVVDVSLEHLRPNHTSNCLRMPSGCLIKEMPNGYSKVIWVEHVEVAMDHKDVHDLYKPLIKCGLAFGAKCWVAKLERHCERLASLMASNIAFQDAGAVTSAEGRKSMMKLAKRIVMSFCSGVGASTGHTWVTLSGSGAEDVRVMTRKSVDDPGRPPGIVLGAATSFWIPVSPKRVFDFLRDESSRSEWDILSNNGVVQEVAHIANGRDPGNCVSLLRVTSTNSSQRNTNSSQRNTNSSQSNMLILQESCTDETGSFVIYAPVDIISMNVVLDGGDPDCVPVLPSGFAILPDGNRTDDGGGTLEVGNGGSLLTVAFQILVDSEPTAKLSLGSVATVNNLISCTVERIKAAVK